MARSVSKGAIPFDLIRILVELFPAEERKEFKFSMPDKRDSSPVGYERYSKQAGNQVEWNKCIVGAVLRDVRDMSDTTGIERELQ